MSNGLTGVTYSWSANANANVAGEGSGISSIIQTITNITPINELVTYVITPTGSNGCIGNTFNYTIRVRPEPIVANQAVTVCSDIVTGITVLGNDADTPTVGTYNITGITTNGLTASAGSPATGNGLAASVLSDDAWTNSTLLPNNVVYTVVPVATTTGCLGDAFTVTVTVNPESVVANQTPTAIC